MLESVILSVLLELYGSTLGAADVVLDFDDAETEVLVVHEVADDEAEVAVGPAGFHCEAALRCVGEGVGFVERHGGRVCVLWQVCSCGSVGGELEVKMDGKRRILLK